MQLAGGVETARLSLSHFVSFALTGDLEMLELRAMRYQAIGLGDWVHYEPVMAIWVRRESFVAAEGTF